jgi:hypothetical protein
MLLGDAVGGLSGRELRWPAHRNVAIYPEQNGWHDFAQGEGGNVVGLVSKALDLTRGEAARWLIELGVERIGRRLRRRAWNATRSNRTRKLPIYSPWRPLRLRRTALRSIRCSIRRGPTSRC